MDPLSLTADARALVNTASKVVKAFSTFGFADTKSRDKLFQLQDTVTAVDDSILIIADLATDGDEHMQDIIEEMKEEMSEIVNDMAVFLGKMNDGMEHPPKRPWINRDIDRLQKRLDMIQRKVHEEISTACGETYL
jgi:uncharacterized protein Yka (UPF0111/DUF47 family)